MFEILVIAFGLGLDAFSLAVAFGMCQKVCTFNTRFRLSLSFGLFQFFMPLAGFYAEGLEWPDLLNLLIIGLFLRY